MGLIYNAGPVSAPGKTKFLANFSSLPEMTFTVIISVICYLPISIHIHFQIKIKGNPPLVL